MKLQNSTIMLLSSEYEFVTKIDTEVASLTTCRIEQDSIHMEGKRGLTLIAYVERIGNEKPQFYRANFTWHVKLTFSRALDDNSTQRYVNIAKFFVLQKSALLVYQLTDQTFHVADIFPPYETDVDEQKS